LTAAALAGSRRTSTAFSRLRTKTNAADAIVFPSQVGDTKPDWTALRRQPEIAQLARWVLSFGQVTGVKDEAILFAAADHQWLGNVDRPIVDRGRMFDPAAPDEVVIGPAAGQEGLHVGSVIDFQAYGAKQDDTSGAPPTGPRVKLHVVGVVRQIDEFLFVPGMILLPPAFLQKYGASSLLAENGMVRLTHGAADMPQLRRDVNALVAQGAPINDLHTIQRRVDTTIGVERSALLLLAAAIAVAGLILVGQALGRSVSVLDDDVLVLRAIGFDRSSIALAPALSHLIVAGVGVVTALATAVVASRWFPIGLASRIDPVRGMHADWVVLGPMALVVVALVLGYAATVGWYFGGPRRPISVDHGTGVDAWVRRVAPLTVGLGTTMAFRRGGERSSGPVRPALIGAMVGVLGVVGTLTIDHGLNDALSHPVRAGVAWDATVAPLPPDLTQHGIAASRVDSVGAVPGVSAAAVVSRLVSSVNGTGVPTYSVQQGVGRVQLVSTGGRAPSADNEAAIGPATARQLHISTGDVVSVGKLNQRVRIVGEAMFPTDVHSGFDEGIWLTPKTLESIEPPVPPGDYSGPSRAIAVRFRPGVRTDAAMGQLARTQGDSIGGVGPAEIPPELSNLRNVRPLPRLLAGFLAFLAIVAIAHVLVTSVRRRRRDFAVLRALGMTRRGVRAILNMHGTAIGAAGLLVGIPLGVATGRVVWRLVTDRVPLHFVPPLALVALLVVAPITIGLVNVLALLPGRRASRLQPAAELRAE
jgi:hypothetical protein